MVLALSKKTMLEKTLSLGRVGGSGKRGRLNVRWVDPIKGDIDLAFARPEWVDQTFRRSFIHRITMGHK